MIRAGATLNGGGVGIAGIITGGIALSSTKGGIKITAKMTNTTAPNKRFFKGGSCLLVITQPYQC